MAEQKWFDAFVDNRSPTLYSEMNRTATTIDYRIFLVLFAFIASITSFLVILPGIRKERFSTFIIVSISLLTGGCIGSVYFGSNWHVAEASITSSYRAFSREKIFADIGVYIGLESVNITLQAQSIHANHTDINYNERFYWIQSNEMKNEHKRALLKGLPYPILTITEYLSVNDEGFDWGCKYRLAGYYASSLLAFIFTFWLFMFLLHCAVPRYGIYCMQLIGLLLILTCLVYLILIPSKPLIIPFANEQRLNFNYGWCFWLTLVCGIVNVFIGFLFIILEIFFPNKLSTILEVDYDTPYRYFVGNDAHVLGNCSSVDPKTISTQCSVCTLADDKLSPISSVNNQSSSSSLLVSSPLIENGKNQFNFNVNDEKLTDKMKDKNSTTLYGFVNDAFNGDVKSEIKTEKETIYIDGKRAVSIHNFGKFADEEKSKSKSDAAQAASSQFTIKLGNNLY